MAQPVGQLSPDGQWLWNGIQWVPNPQVAAPPTAVAWAKPYESARYRATLLTIFLAANIVGLAIGIAFDFVQIVFGSKQLTDAESIVVGLVALAFLLTYVGTFIPAIVFFCMWLHRVVRNMPALGASDPRWSPAGAVGRSFIPFLNLAHPMSGTLEAWRGSNPARGLTNVTERKAMGVPGLIGAWWTLWLIGWWLSTVASQIISSNDAGTAATGYWIEVLGSFLTIGSAVLAVFVVRDVTARQDRKNELIVSGMLA